VQKRVKPYLDLQLVAFPQDGVLRAPGALHNLKRALAMGVDVVGGIPHFERTMADGAESVRVLCEIAADLGKRVDMHCDESDDPLSRHVETLAYHTQRLELHGRVAGSHLTSMHSMDNYYVSKLIPLMKEAGLAAIANPLINITLQGTARHLSQASRHDARARAHRRGRAGRVRPRLRAWTRGIRWAAPTCSRSRRWGLHVAQMTGQAAMRAVLRRGDDDARVDPRPRRLRARPRVPRRPGAARGARSGRGDPAARDAPRRSCAAAASWRQRRRRVRHSTCRAGRRPSTACRKPPRPMESIYYVMAWACHRKCRHCYEDRFRPYVRGELEASSRRPSATSRASSTTSRRG
jgi:hypothetical protein